MCIEIMCARVCVCCVCLYACVCEKVVSSESGG